MNFFSKLRARKRDMQTLAGLLGASVERAGADGESHAGAHHLLLAALEMEDGTARQVFARLGTDAEQVIAALGEHDSVALRSLGLPDELADLDTKKASVGRQGKTDATYEAAMKNVYAIHNERGDYRPLIGAHVVGGVAEIDRGVSARVFDALNLDRTRVIEAARLVADAAS